MSAPLRFLVLLAAAWIGVRSVSTGLVPGFTIGYADRASARPLAPIEPTQFPPLPPVESAALPPVAYPFPYPYAQQWPAVRPSRPFAYYAPAGYASYAVPDQPIPPRRPWSLPSVQGTDSEDVTFFTPIKPIAQWDVAELAAFPPRRSEPATQMSGVPPPRRALDRLQLTSWALLRGSPSPGALAAGGTLGGSQAGARLLYAFDRRFAASLRTTSPVGGSRGAEIAAGVRFTPFPSLPIALTAERRQSISPHGGGRSAFSLFAEGGLYRRPMPWQFQLDAYAQAGIVGLRSRDYFADGAFTLTRPIYGRFSAGFGVWGGAQPGIYRVDAGPRVSIRLRDNIHAHVDYRQRIAGSAQPASGPALTLAADF